MISRNGFEVLLDQFALRMHEGASLVKVGALPEALDAFGKAFALKPVDLQAWRQLMGIVPLANNEQEVTTAWTALGDVLRASRRPWEALPCYQCAIARKPDCVRAHHGLGHVYIALDDPRRAIEHFEAGLQAAPAFLQLKTYLGCAYYLAGELERAWDAFTSYYESRRDKWGAFEQPLWDGSPLNGRRILLWAERGRGDVIQFMRYVEFVSGRGGRVIVECAHPGLVKLLQGTRNVCQVVQAGTILPAFDVHAPLMYFPALYADSREPVPNLVPYLFVDDRLRTNWRTRLGDAAGLRVGICWKGNESHRSAGSRFVPLSAFAALAGVPGVRLISLQFGAELQEFVAAGERCRVERLFGDSFPIEDAAALILELDLVITVDTMTAHLAGALGKPVWTLLRHAADWRWQRESEVTPWYPTMRLFRQNRWGEWDAVFERVQTALIETIQARASLKERAQT